MTANPAYLTASDIVAGDALQTDVNGRNYIQWSTDTNVFVQAGAGSGKTTTLIQRLLTLLIDDGLSINQLAAITFTEAAAAKLVADLRAALSQVAEQCTHTPFPDAETTVFRKVTAQEASRRAAAALEGLPGASIGTLHSFCLRLLKQYPLEAGLPPKVDKVDELRQQMDASLRADSVVDLLTRLVGAEEEALADLEGLVAEYGLQVDPAGAAADLQFLLTNGVKMRDFGERARWMDAHWGELGPTLTGPRWHPQPEDEFKREWLEVLRAVQAAYDASGGPADDALRKALGGYLAAVDEHRDPSREDTGREPADYPSIRGGKKDWDSADVSAAERALEARGVDHRDWANKKVVAELLKHCKAELAGRELIHLQQAVDHVTPVIAALVMRDKDRRVRRGTLEYHDMIYLAKGLVEDEGNAEILRRLHEQYRVIFVDEFQDTDPAQYAIVRRIAAGSLNGAPTPGSLFMVGDPKQSIYRFRNADIDNYNLVKSAYSLDGAGEGVLLNLSQNFRSSHNVITAVNAIFAEVFADDGRGPGAPTQASYADMLAQAVPEGVGPDGAAASLPGKVILLRDEEPGSDADAARAAEEADIVALVRAATRGGDPTFYYHQTKKRRDERGNLIEGPGAARPLTYSDIAVLVPTNRDSRRVIRALTKAGIPSVSEGSTSLFRVPEVNDLLTVLRAVGDPADRYAEVAALRTAMLGCSDAELAADALGQGGDGRVEKQRAWLRETAKKAQGRDVGEAVRDIAQSKHLRLAYVASSRVDSVGSLDHVVELAEQFGRATGLGLREFVRWADEQAEDRGGASDPVLANNAEGVRVMTVHRSKGLEFPMVIAAGLGGQPRRFSLDAGMSRTNPRLAQLKLGSAASYGHAELSAFEAQADKDEIARQLYVALTRAESVLAVPLQIPNTKTGYGSRRGTPLLKAVDSAIEKAGPRAAELADAGLVLRTREWLNAPTDPLGPLGTGLPDAEEGALALRRSRGTDARAALAAAAHTAPRIGVTAIAHAADATAAEAGGEPGEGSDGPEAASISTGSSVRALLAQRGWVPQGNFEPVDAHVARRGMGTHFGSAVHEVMERLPGSDLGVDELARIAAALGGLPDEQAPAVAEVARAFASSEPYQRALAAPQALRELPVAGRVGETAVNGYIDLLYQEGGHWVIADYKTDVYASRERVESYLTQLELYARLLGDALGAPVVRLELIFQDGDGAQVVTHRRG